MVNCNSKMKINAFPIFILNFFFGVMNEYILTYNIERIHTLTKNSIKYYKLYEWKQISRISAYLQHEFMEWNLEISEYISLN